MYAKKGGGILQLYYVVSEDELPDHCLVKKIQDDKKNIVVDEQKEKITVKTVFMRTCSVV